MERTIGLSLSGGGFRAAAFGLGALIYLKDAGLHRRVSSIASVSGGSLTNAFVGYRSKFRSGDDPSKFLDEIRSLAYYLSYGGFSFEIVPRILLIVFLLGCSGSILATLDFFLASDLSLVMKRIWYSLFLVVCFILAISVPLSFFRILNSLYAYTLNRDLFKPVNAGTRDPSKSFWSFWLKSLIRIPQLPKGAILLKDLSVDIDHILCATDLSMASHFFLAPRFLLSSKYGFSPPCGLPVATAVLASAAFPGVFAPVRLSVSDYRFAKEATLGIKTITLGDGGLHDNLGTPFSITGSRRDKSPLGGYSAIPEQLIAVNSSSRDQVYVELPKNAITSRLFGLFRQFAVVHDSNSAARARAVEETFLRALEDKGEYMGTVVSIEESPIEVCEEVLREDFLDGSRSKKEIEILRLRAKEMLKVFATYQMDNASWNGLRRQNAENVRTTLAGLGPDIVAGLMFHGYVLTMVKCRLFLGLGNGEVVIPSQYKFEELCHRDSPVPVFRDRLNNGSKGPEMIVVPAGTFKMGDINDNGNESEKPVRTVRIAKSFAIGRYPVIFDEYDRFTSATGRPSPNDQHWGRGRRPAINVTWDDATEYAKWLSEQTGKRYRLPTEAEWEYAARAGTETKYWWGSDMKSSMANCQDGDSRWAGKQTSPVGSFPKNPFGLYDTAGNVMEWVEDCWHENYKGGAPTDGSAWLENDCSVRVMRGGSFNATAKILRSSHRTKSSASTYYDNVGFRLAQDLD